MKLSVFIFLLLSQISFGQIEYSRDTVNSRDADGNKQGYWVRTGDMLKSDKYADTSIVDYGLYQDNMKTGIWTKLYPDGNVKSEIEYVNNKPQGTYRTYHNNGNLKEESTLQWGHYHGHYRKYYYNGCLKVETFYKMGYCDSVMVYYKPNCIFNENRKGTVKRRVDCIEKPTFIRVPEDRHHYTLSDAPSASCSSPSDSIPRAYPDGYYFFACDTILIEGEFVGYRLYDGKAYHYDKNGLLYKITLYKEGKYAGDGVLEF